MIIYLFTSKTLQHIGTHINQNVCIIMYIVISIHWIQLRLLILFHLKAWKLQSLKLFHDSHESHKKGRQPDNPAATGGTISCHSENSLCHQRRPSRQNDNPPLPVS